MASFKKKIELEGIQSKPLQNMSLWPKVYFGLKAIEKK